jgi:NADH:ubiquinone oxidoreductase subunit F (NADH-binding)
VRDGGGVIGASVLWALGGSSCPIDEMSRVASWMAGESAGQCGPCMFGLPSVADDVRALAIRDGHDLLRLRNRLKLVSNRGGCKHPDGVARFVATGLAAFSDEVDLHLDGRCSVAGHRSPSDPYALPVPPVRMLDLDPQGKDFA